MSHSRYHRSQGGPHLGGSRYQFHTNGSTIAANNNFDNYDNLVKNHNGHENSRIIKGNNYQFDAAPSSKRRRSSVTSWEYGGCYPSNTFIDVPSTCYSDLIPPAPTRLDVNAINAYNPVSHKRDRSKLEVDDVDFMSRDEIEKRSPSRKDGIDALREAHLRYSYCAFLQNLGLRLDIPQTTVGTAMVLCHRFFVRRSHACHDRFMVATAALFLATKSEETPCPLNNVVKASCEIVNKQDISLLSCIFPADWFEQYRERVIEAEQLILTTLNFELNVQHPYDPLTSILEKLGFSQSVLVNMALNLVSEGLRSSLWLQFKPHHIAAGAAYLAAKYLNMDLAPSHRIWSEFKTPAFIVEDVARQLMELF